MGIKDGTGVANSDSSIIQPMNSLTDNCCGKNPEDKIIKQQKSQCQTDNRGTIQCLMIFSTVSLFGG